MFSASANILSLLTSIAYLVGASSGTRDATYPLGTIDSGTAVAREATPTLPFTHIKNIAELDARIAAANGKPVMLYYYADWCASCKDMERSTFSDPRVQARLKNAVLLQADVTAQSNDDRALLTRYHLFGPPATLFFTPQGHEQSDLRIVGYQDADRFLQSLQQAGL